MYSSYMLYRLCPKQSSRPLSLKQILIFFLCLFALGGASAIVALTRLFLGLALVTLKTRTMFVTVFYSS